MALRIGLIGAGRMGQVFADALAFSIAEADFVALADANETTARDMAGRCGVPKHYTDYRRMLDEVKMDAVCIITPTATHPDVIEEAAARGIHIFSEKPLAMTLTECDRAIAAAKAAGVKLQVGFMRHYDAAYALAKQKIDEGVIGHPVMFKSTGRDPRRTSLEFAKRENGGGMILDMGIHDFDLARWLMGAEVERVSSEGGCLVYPELETVGDIDNAVVNLKFANGAIGNVDISRNAVYGYDIRTEVLGSEGGLLIGKLQQTSTLVMTREGICHDVVPYFMERFGEAYAAEVRDFVRAVLDNREPEVSGADARAATAIGVAATMSFDEGRPVLVSEAG